MKLPKLMKLLLTHKKNYNMASNPDSIHSRSNAAQAGTQGDGDIKSNQRGGKEIEKMLNIKNPPQPNPSQPRTNLNMMDIVLKMWDKDFYYDKEIEDREEQEEKEHKEIQDIEEEDV